jgi:opacity protein-like surface antigen
MRKALIFLILMFLVFQALRVAAMAQEKYGFEVGAYAGPVDWKPRSFQVGPPQASPPIPLGFRYDDRPIYGGRFNLLSHRYWGGELSYGYQRNTVTLSRASFTPVKLKGAIHEFFYNTVFYPLKYRTARVMPFATGGIGLAAYQLSDEARSAAGNPRIYGIGTLKSFDRRFAFNYGGGIKAELIPHVGVRVDFRHNFSDVPSYGLPKESSNPAQTVLPIQGKLQNYEATVGIYFHFLK